MIINHKIRITTLRHQGGMSYRIIIIVSLRLHPQSKTPRKNVAFSDDA